MKDYNEISHTWKFELFDKKFELGFTEWQCIASSIFAGFCYVLVGLLLATYRFSGAADTPRDIAIKQALESVPWVTAYLDFLAYLLPAVLILGGLLMFRRYSGLHWIISAFTAPIIFIHPERTGVLDNVALHSLPFIMAFFLTLGYVEFFKVFFDRIRQAHTWLLRRRAAT